MEGAEVVAGVSMTILAAEEDADVAEGVT